MLGNFVGVLVFQYKAQICHNGSVLDIRFVRNSNEDVRRAVGEKSSRSVAFDVKIELKEEYGQYVIRDDSMM